MPTPGKRLPIAVSGPILSSIFVLLSLLCPGVSNQHAYAQEPSPQALYDEAGKAMDKGDAQRAIKLYKQVLDKAPASIEARTNLGVALAQEGHYTEAVAEYREALKRDPQNRVVLLNLALALYKQADFEAAAAGLERLRPLDPGNKQALYLLSDCYLRLGKYHDVIVLLQPEYAAHPEDPAVQYALGTALIQDGQMEKGAEVIDHILKNGNSAVATLLLGASQYAAGDYGKAANSVRKALDLDATLPGAWTIYGEALLSSGDIGAAKAAFQRALQSDPNDFNACLHLGGMLRHDGDLDQAAPYLTRALTLRPASAAARFQVGALNLATGHLEDARNQLEGLVKEFPDFLEAHVQLAMLYARMNRPQDSERERKIILALNDKARSKGPQPERP